MSRKNLCYAVRYCAVFVLILLSSSLFAQKKVSGTVLNARDNQPVSGATVLAKGTTTGVTTAANGTFSINLPAGNNTLVVSYVGFTDQEVDVSNSTNINVMLKESSSNLNEVVVTGYTAQKKKDITGSVSVVNVESMNKVPTGQINNQLQGQAAGVTVIGSGQPGEEPQVRIRGVNTFGNNSPLYVVDGVPTTNISDLNPNDVASLQVLKDAGAASIYGSRANNGVIIITTKRGKGKTNVSYDAYYGTQQVQKGNPWNLLDPQGNADLMWLALKNSGQTLQNDLYGNGATPVLPDYIYPTGAKEGDPSVDPSKYYVNPEYTDSKELNNFYRINKANKQGTDWFHEVNKNAPIQNHNLNVSGGNDKNQYLFSLNYLNQQGTVINTYQKKFSIRANTQFSIGKRIRVGENLSYTINNNPRIGALSEGSVIGYAFREMPIIPVYDIMGNFAGNYGGQLGNSLNPYATAYRTRNNKSLGNRLFGNIYGDVDILSGLTFHTQFGGESYSGYSRSFGYPSYENVENTTTNRYNEGSWYGYNWTWTNTLTYHKVFKDHDAQVMVGTEAYNEYNENAGGSTTGYFSFDPNYTTLSSGAGTPTNYSGRSYLSLWSQFARLDYQFRSRYLLSATIRRDGSSKFTEANKFGYFPAVTLGWRLSQENFMKNITWLSDLKIRGGWGVMGNQLNLGADNQYYTFNQDRNASYYDIGGTNNTINQGFRTGQIANQNAKWEKDINTNVGVDASLFKNRIQFTADYYVKNIKDLLLNPALPGTAGAGTVPYVNIAEMKTTGIDASLSDHENLTKDLKLDVTLTYTSYKNTIQKVNNTSDYFYSGGTRRFGQNFIINKVGEPTGAFYGYKIAGFFNSQADIDAANEAARKATGDQYAVYEADAGVGRFKYVDVNGDGVITSDDRTILGSPHPDFTYGINIGLSYKNFDFSAFFYGSQGNETWNNVKYWTDLYPTFTGAKSYTALNDSWTPTHMNAKAPIVETKGYFSTTTQPTSFYIEDGSYLRAKYMILGYTFNQKTLSKAGIQSLRFYVQAANLFTITKYSGVDPELNNGSVTEFGVDEGSYPTTKQFIFGLNVKF
jgi:TonB-linked SusC/RagA family outer membrane protein